MGQLQKIESQLTELGYQILAINADRPEKLAEAAKKNPLTYTLLSDSQLIAARAFGVAFRVDDDMFGKLKGFGIDLEEASGETHHGLPVPAVFVVDTDGKIHFQYANPDYKVRVDTEVLLSAARAARG